MKNRLMLFFSLIAVTLSWAAPGKAQDQVRIFNPDARQVEAYWTPERLKAARPMPLPLAVPGIAMPPKRSARPAGTVQSADGRAPSLQLRPVLRRLFEPEPAKERAVATPHAADNDNFAPYTSSRVFPMFDGTAAPYSADRAYPYITTGKLFFSANGKPAFCSAAVIQHRIVVTAGHCVHSGRYGHFYSNWMFVPAFRDGSAPLLTWTWRSVIVTSTWVLEGAQPFNAADYAMIVFRDQAVNGVTRALGDLTGWLGWQTLSLHSNHTTKLGYACNLDNCQKMQKITSADAADIVESNVLSGADARSGFDGAPWIQNFQLLQVGGGAGSNAGPNRVVGVTSWIWNSPDRYNTQEMASSTPDGRWISILNTLCSESPGNCL